MLSTLVLAAGLLAPAAPAPATTAPGGPAPRFLELRPDDDGKIMISVSRHDVQAQPPVPPVIP
jgi:hypothetical protein